MTTNQNYRIIRLTVTIEPKSPQGGNERCYVARDDQGVWRTYGSVINKPFSMSVGRYLFHAEEIEAEGDGWIDFREYYSA